MDAKPLLKHFHSECDFFDPHAVENIYFRKRINSIDAYVSNIKNCFQINTISSLWRCSINISSHALIKEPFLNISLSFKDESKNSKTHRSNQHFKAQINTMGYKSSYRSIVEKWILLLIKFTFRPWHVPGCARRDNLGLSDSFKLNKWPKEWENGHDN